MEDFQQPKIVVLGNMAELGDKSNEIHTKIGEYAKSLNIDYYYSIGELAKNYGFTHFENKQSLIVELKQHKNMVILFKASRSARLEEIIADI